MKIIKKNKDAEIMVCQEIRDGHEQGSDQFQYLPY